MFLLFSAISVTALFGRVADFGSYHHICYPLHNKTYNFIINHTGSDSWPCGNIDITDTHIRIECVSQNDGAFKGQFTNCDGGKSCRKYGFYSVGYEAIYKNSNEHTWGIPPTGVSDEDSYWYEEYKHSSWFLEDFSTRVTKGNNACSAAFIQSTSITNNSIYREQLFSIVINTDIPAICKYANVSEVDFSNMTLFNYTNSTSHNFSVNVEDNTSYNYYFKCNNTLGDISSSDYYFNFFSEWSIPAMELNDSLPSNLTANITLFLFSNFSDSGGGFAANNSCEFCAAQDGTCDTEWSSSNVTTNYSTDYLSGTCSYTWNTSKYNDNNYEVGLRIEDTAYNTGISSKEITLDRTGPNFHYSNPKDNGAYMKNNTNPENITYSSYGLRIWYKVDDLSQITNCSLISNDKINYTDNSIHINDNRFILNISTAINSTRYYNWSIACTDVFGHESVTDTKKFTLIVINHFSGETTDLGEVNLSHVENLTFEEITSGKIRFSDSINLSGIDNINDYIKISNNRIEINSSGFPALNKSATLDLYNLTYNNPRILRDGEVCPSNICKIVNYSNGKLIFNVTQFSVYSTEETPDEPTSSGDGGGSSGGGGGGGGGSGGGGAFFVCNQDWKCDAWSSCQNGKQTKSCSFVKVTQHTQSEQCPQESNPPVRSKTCETPKETPKLESLEKTEEEIKEEVIETQQSAITQKSSGLSAITGAVTRIFTNPKAARELKISVWVIIVSAFSILGYQFAYKTEGPKYITKRYKNIVKKLQKIKYFKNK